jgi:hypothetical protein
MDGSVRLGTTTMIKLPLIIDDEKDVVSVNVNPGNF